MTPTALQQLLASPKQLAILIYDTWGVPFDSDHGYSDKGIELIRHGYIIQRGKRLDRTPELLRTFRSAGKTAMTFLIEEHSEEFPQLILIKKYRGIDTKMNKFIKGPQKAKEYLGSEIMRHSSKLNSTYTGRCTVRSKVRQ